jgi:hypothetical protein
MAQGSFWGIDDPVQRLRGGLDEIRCHAHTSGSPRRLIFFLFTFFYQQQCFFPKGLIVLLFCTETHTKSYCVFNKRVETFCNKLSVARLSLSIPPLERKRKKEKEKKSPPRFCLFRNYQMPPPPSPSSSPLRDPPTRDGGGISCLYVNAYFLMFKFGGGTLLACRL